MKNKKIFFLIFIIIPFFVFCGFLKQNIDLTLFSKTLSLIKLFYVSDVDSSLLIKAGIQGMVRSLDERSRFLFEDDVKKINFNADGKFAGIGIEFMRKDNEYIIITPLEDSPSETAGLLPGDKIISVNEKSVSDKTLEDVVDDIRGEPGSKVNLTINRNDKEILNFSIPRDNILVKSVKFAGIIDNKIGYIRIAKFQEQTPDELKEVLRKLKNQNISSLIIDLRSNPGGLLSQVIECMDYFLPKGSLVVSIKGRHKGQNKDFESKKNDLSFSLPVVVLINKGTASAAEIFAGAIRDSQRGAVVGQKSFGKGSIQTVYPIGDYAVKLTTGYFYSPSGACIDKAGIIPDIEAEAANKRFKHGQTSEIIKIDSDKLEDNILIKAVDFLRL